MLLGGHFTYLTRYKHAIITCMIESLFRYWFIISCLFRPNEQCTLRRLALTCLRSGSSPELLNWTTIHLCLIGYSAAAFAAHRRVLGSFFTHIKVMLFRDDTCLKRGFFCATYQISGIVLSSPNKCDRHAIFCLLLRDFRIFLF